MQVVDSEGYLKVKLVGGPVGPFVPYTGATANVNLGEYEIKAGQFTLDTSPTGTAVVGTTRWNDSIGSSETTLKGGSVILKNGVDLVARVVNKVTPNATLTKANYTAVRISGAQGQRLAVAYAQANNDANSADTIGLVAETIPTNQEGFIITVGNLEGVNTTGALQGETWADGDVLYLSPTTPGAITNIKPNGSTGHIIVIGYVEYAHAINGKIYVKIMNGWELDELHNVYINPATLANNNILQYDSADQLWKNKVLSTGITIGSTAIASGTVGRILFEGAGNVVQESSSLFWDATNNRLGIGTSAPASTFEVVAGSDANGIKLRGRSADNISNFFFSSNDGLSQYGYFQHRSSVMRVVNNVGDTEFWNGPNIGSTVQRATLFGATGNLGLNTTTDAGFKLDVNGTARVQNVLTIQNLTADLYVRTTAWSGQSRIWFGDDSSDTIGGINYEHQFDRMNLRTNAGTRMSIFSTGNVGINTTTDAGFRLDVNGTARVSGQLTATADAVINGVNIGIGTGSQVTNTRVGRFALNFNTTGIRNTSVGQEALYANTTGSNNSAFGRGAIAVNTTGGNNSALGQNALFNNTTGNNNTVIGNNSLFAHTTGDSNSALGADTVSGNFSGSVILGREATATANNQFVVGSTGTNAGSVTSEVNTSTQVWNVVINGVARKILLA